MKIWVHLLEREINLMGRPRTGAKDHAGNFSERKQTLKHVFTLSTRSSCLYVNYRFNWSRVICDYVLIWIYKECTRAKQTLVFFWNLSFPRVFVSPGGHSVRRIRRTKPLSQNSWKYDFVIVNILVLSWLLTWYESLSSSVMFGTLSCSPYLNWQFGNQFCFVNGEFHCIIFKIIQNLILNPKTTNTKTALRARKVTGTFEKGPP